MSLTEKQFLNLKKAVNSPVWYAENVIGIELEDYQKDILKSIGKNRKVAVKSGHGVGKTTTAAIAVNWFFDTRINSKTITTATSWRQVIKMLWPEIHKWRRQAVLEKIGVYPDDWEELNLMLKRTKNPEWYATGESSDDHEKMEGFHAPNIMYVVDEGKAVPQKTYEAIEGALTNAEGEVKQLVISTPPPQKSGYFYEVFQGKRVGYEKFSISCYESERVSKGWIEERKQEWGEDSPMFITRVLGEFADAGENTLFPLAWVSGCIDKDVDSGDKVLGVDVARFGTDSTVITKRNGQKVIGQIVMKKRGTMETVGRIKSIIKEEGYELVNVDVIGVGAGVVDRLKEDEGIDVRGINVAQNANDKERFKNLRAEMYWGLRQRFKDGDISIPDDEQLVSQLTSMEYKYNSRGQLQIESKEDMKKRGLKSPDKADSLALAFFVDHRVQPDLLIM